MNVCGNFLSAISRRKTIDNKRLFETDLRRTLNVADILGLGFGGLGLSIFILITHVAHYVTGPSVILSVLLAGVAAILSGLCYAEFSVRLPRAGSSYTYAYSTIGELCGFIIGWTMILENALGVAVAAKTWSQYVDHLANGTIQRYLNTKISWSTGSTIDTSPDFLAVSVLLFCALLLICGTKITTIANCILCTMSMIVIFCVICVGFFHVDSNNWKHGDGFFKSGFQGVLSGAAILFFSFIIIDGIMTTAEEAKNPIKNLPVLTILITVMTVVIMLAVSASVTLIYPSDALSTKVALPKAFENRHIKGARYVFSIGGLMALTATVITLLYAIPRLLFSISKDNLLCEWLGYTYTKAKTPCVAIVIAFCLSLFLTLCFRLDVLLSLLGVGSLSTFCVVSVCVLCLRYQQSNVGLLLEYEEPDDGTCNTEFIYPSYDNKQCEYTENHLYHNEISCNGKPRGSTYQKMNSIVSVTTIGSESSIFPIHLSSSMEPSHNTWILSASCFVTYVFANICLSLILTFGCDSLYAGSWWSIFLLIVFISVMLVSACILWKQPQNKTKPNFKTPLVPAVPLLVLTFNISMMTSLSATAWIRFFVWTILGIIVYFAYGFNHSKERICDEQEVILYEVTEASVPYINNK